LKINSPDASRSRYRLWLLFWPLFGLRYLLIENYHPAQVYHVISCPLDYRILFQEAFIIPYLLWHSCVIGMHIFLCFRDVPAFKWYTRYLIITISLSTAAFLLYPTCQNLRPEVFPRDNFLTDVVKLLYRADTSTNVCPSEHVIGSVGFFLAARHSSVLGTPGKTFLFGITAFFTGIATVFLKQHSLVDVAAAVPVCVLGWFAAYRWRSSPEHSWLHRIKNKIRPGRSAA